MASGPSESPPDPIRRGTSTTRSDKSRMLGRSISTKEASFSEFPYTPPGRTLPPSLSHSLHASPVSSPLRHSNTCYRCISSVLRKDGQILSMASSSHGLLYTGSQTNVILVWNLPDFSHCGQLKTKASMVVALHVSHDRLYAAYGDAKIRVWQISWDGSFNHVRLSTIPISRSYVRSYIAGKAKTVC